MKKPPRIVQQLIPEQFKDTKELRGYLRRQQQFYNRLERKAIDFPGWLAFKLSCTKRSAHSLLKWLKGS